MPLPPFANLFAVYDVDPRKAEAFAADFEESGVFAEVWRPASGWVAAALPLPDAATDGRIVRENRLAFAEGRAVLETRSGKTPAELFRSIAELADLTPDRLARLPGDFGFIRFRPHGEATVVRSCAGLVPFYIQQTSERTTIGTRLGDFVRFLPEEPRLDPMVNAIWANGYTVFPDGRSFLADISVIGRGCFAQIGRERKIRSAPYWKPRPKKIVHPTLTLAREHTTRLRSLLLDKLTGELDSTGENLLSLSGGVDSTALAALAAGTLQRKVSAFSLLPTPEKEFEYEMSYIRHLMNSVKIDRHWITRVHPEMKREMLAEAPPVVAHILHPTLLSLPEIQREVPITVLFGGEFADEVCGSIKTLPDWVAHNSLLKVLTHLSLLPTGRRDLLRWIKHRRLSALNRPMLPFADELPGFIRRNVREEYREWLERRRTQAASDSDAHRFLALNVESSEFTTMNWEATSALGIRRCFPFFNREALELAFECHPNELVGPGTKKILRASLHDDVPRKNLYRSDKGGWGTYLRGAQLPWRAALPASLENIIQEKWFPTPPTLIEYDEACSLSQLVVFQESIYECRLSRKRLSCIP